MSKKEDRFALVNVTWNKDKWEKVDRESISKHGYPGLKHEHLNFKFDKSCDSNKYIYGYVPALRSKRKLCYDKNAVIFFIATDHKKHERKIVGVYGNVKMADKTINIPEYKKEGGLYLNIRAEKKYSMCFSNYLNAKVYPEVQSMRQTTIRYIDESTAIDILLDAIKECGVQDREQLHYITELVTGHSLKIKDNETIVERLVEETPDVNLKEMIENIPIKPNKIITQTVSVHERDCKITEAIKKLRGRQCQICGMTITTKHGIPYVEAAHITPKREGGNERPENIIILCPNHHKEFDLGNKKILTKEDTMVVFILNGKNYQVDLSLQPPNQN